MTAPSLIEIIAAECPTMLEEYSALIAAGAQLGRDEDDIPTSAADMSWALCGSRVYWIVGSIYLTHHCSSAGEGWEAHDMKRTVFADTAAEALRKLRSFGAERVYLAGPMRGHPENNFPAFRTAAVELRRHFAHVVSPVEINHGPDAPERSNEEYLRRDLRELLDCQAIAMLPGWERSVGACCEAAVAVSLGLRFVTVEGGEGHVPALVEVRGDYGACAG